MRLSPRARSASTLTFAADSPTCPCNDAIKRDGQAITNANNKLVVGQQVNLSIDCTDHSSEMTDIKWTIPDTAFKDYQVSVNQATAIVPLATSDKNKKQITFYWSD